MSVDRFVVRQTECLAIQFCDSCLASSLGPWLGYSPRPHTCDGHGRYLVLVISATPTTSFCYVPCYEAHTDFDKAGFKVSQDNTGAVTLTQRFDSALNLNLHFHVLGKGWLWH